MYSLISALLLALNISNSGDLILKVPDPTCSCSLAVGTYTGNQSDFNGCGFDPGVLPCDCRNCTYFNLQLQCNDGCVCCLDQITITGPVNACFEGCAKTNTPTAPWWLDVTRGGNSCQTGDLILSPDPSGGTELCSFGAVLSVKLCGPSGTYTIQGHTAGNCSGLGGTITTTVTIP